MTVVVAFALGVAFGLALRDLILPRLVEVRASVLRRHGRR